MYSSVQGFVAAGTFNAVVCELYEYVYVLKYFSCLVYIIQIVHRSKSPLFLFLYIDMYIYIYTHILRHVCRRAYIVDTKYTTDTLSYC